MLHMSEHNIRLNLGLQK